MTLRFVSSFRVHVLLTGTLNFTKNMKQTTNSILMIRPVAFRMNEQTAVNNYYQKVLGWSCNSKCKSATGVC
jgi:hypothetical protein